MANSPGKNMYDLIIIGGGSAAFSSFLKAVELGSKRIAIVEEGQIGGTCVNRGCIPSKSLLKAGEIFYYSRHPFYRGIHLTGKIDIPEIIKEKNRLVKKLRKKKYIDILKDTPEAELIQGRGLFISPNEVKIGNRIIGSDRIIIATGAKPSVPDIPGIEKIPYITSKEALNIDKLPNRVTIIGGRYVALEFAQIFRHFGSKVSILQRNPRIIPQEEGEISEEMKNILQDEGIEVYTGTTVTGVDPFKDKMLTFFEYEGEKKKISSDVLLLATGIVGNTELNLERAGVDLNEKGFIPVDETLKTSAENIWASGDITGKHNLVTVAAHQGAIAAVNALSKTKRQVDYSIIPHTIFTSPQIASVGLTDREANETGIPCSCRVLPMEWIPKAQAIHDTRGLIKMVAHEKTGQVLGIHILAHEASEVIHQGVLILKKKMTIEEVSKKIDVYPTMSEMVKLCALSFFKNVEKLSCCAG